MYKQNRAFNRSSQTKLVFNYYCFSTSSMQNTFSQPKCRRNPFWFTNMLRCYNITNLSLIANLSGKIPIYIIRQSYKLKQNCFLFVYDSVIHLRAKLFTFCFAGNTVFVGPTGLPQGTPTGLTPGKRRKRYFFTFIIYLKNWVNFNCFCFFCFSSSKISVFLDIKFFKWSSTKSFEY